MVAVGGLDRIECVSKRMYPDILNDEQVVKVIGSFKTPMGCSSFLSSSPPLANGGFICGGEYPTYSTI